MFYYLVGLTHGKAFHWVFRVTTMDNYPQTVSFKHFGVKKLFHAKSDAELFRTFLTANADMSDINGTGWVTNEK